MRLVLAFLFALLVAPALAYDGVSVSVAPLSNGGILVARCGGLDLYDASAAERKELQPVFPAGAATFWNPTGVYSYGGKVYVANYRGHNLFRGTVEGTEYRIEQVIESPNLKSPENIAADTDGIAVADYDAQAIMYFNHDGTLRWTRPLILAHGVALAYGHVYGTSLSPEGLVKLDPKTGETVAQNTTYGRKGFIYPTTLFSVKDSAFPGDLAVIDANRGAIIFVDRDLNIVETFGRNSPYLWLRPYGGEIIGNRMLVTDTEGRRLVWLTPGLEVATAADHGERIHVGHAQDRGADGAECTYDRLPVPPGFPMVMALRGGWQGGCTVEGGRTSSATVIFPSNTYLAHRPANFFSSLWGATVSQDGQDYTVYGSPSRSVYMVARRDDYVFVNLDPRLVIWGPEGAEKELTGIVTAARSALDDLQSATERCGALTAFLRYSGVDGDLGTTLPKVMLYPNAKTLAARWIAGGMVTNQEIDGLALSATQGAFVSLDDIALLRRMATSSFEAETVRFRECK